MTKMTELSDALERPRMRDEMVLIETGTNQNEERHEKATAPSIHGLHSVTLDSFPWPSMPLVVTAV